EAHQTLSRRERAALSGIDRDGLREVRIRLVAAKDAGKNGAHIDKRGLRILRSFVDTGVDIIVEVLNLTGELRRDVIRPQAATSNAWLGEVHPRAIEVG